MKNIFGRRAVAAVATAGLLLVAAPAVTPASAADSCALGATCDGSLSGSLGATTFQIKMPAAFNGTVLLYSHGYRIGTPVPAALATPLGLAASSDYVKTSVPAFAQAFGTDVAYVGSPAAAVAPGASVADTLLGQGYALAGAGYARQGWASAEGVEANELLIRYINSGGIKGVKKIFAWGSSLGGLISATVAQRNPGKIAGNLPMCGVVAGPEQAFSSAMTVLFDWKTLINPNLRVANYQSYTQALGDLASVLGTLNAVATGQASVSPVGFPIAQANLLGGLMAGLPTKSAVYDGITVNPAFASLGTAAALAGGFSPASAGANSAAAMLQNVGAAAALGILGRYELEQRVRAMTGMAATDNANFNDNVNVSYTNLLSPEQKGEFGDTLNAYAAIPGLLNVMLGTLDASKGNAAARFAANPAAVQAVRSLPAPNGTSVVPTVLISTTYDPIVPAGNTQWLYQRLLKVQQAKAKKTGGVVKVSQFYTVPVPEAWTVIDPGAKGVNSAASAAQAVSGVGHCNFAIGNGIQLINAVAALNRIVNAKTTKQIKNANHLVYGTVGVNNDGFFEPDPLKVPALSN